VTSVQKKRYTQAEILEKGTGNGRSDWGAEQRLGGGEIASRSFLGKSGDSRGNTVRGSEEKKPGP